MTNDPNEVDLSSLSVEGLYEIAVKEWAATASDLIWRDPHNPFQLLGDIDPEDYVEEIGSRINNPPGVVFYGKAKYWEALRKEFRLFLCTKNRKYDSTKRALRRSADTTQLAIVSIIAASVGRSLGTVAGGVVAGSLVRLCALCLIACLKMGKEAFCREEKLMVQVGPEIRSAKDS